MTPEEIANRIANDYLPVGTIRTAGFLAIQKDIATALRSYGDMRANTTYKRVCDAIIGQSNTLPEDADDGFYAGYKLAIRNVLAAQLGKAFHQRGALVHQRGGIANDDVAHAAVHLVDVRARDHA